MLKGTATVLQIVKYPHPALRHKSRPLRQVDGELKKIVRGMFDLMYQQKGVGLAANQVALPYRLFIINLESDPEKSQEHVFINPTILRRRGNAEAEEGCLSFPEIYVPIVRSEKIEISAYNLKGEEVVYRLDGLFARAVQHEYDHLEGVILVDRLSPTAMLSIKDSLEELELEFQGQQQRGTIPSNERIVALLAELEAART